MVNKFYFLVSMAMIGISSQAFASNTDDDFAKALVATHPLAMLDSLTDAQQILLAVRRSAMVTGGLPTESDEIALELNRSLQAISSKLVESASNQVFKSARHVTPKSTMIELRPLYSFDAEKWHALLNSRTYKPKNPRHAAALEVYYRSFEATIKWAKEVEALFWGARSTLLFEDFYLGLRSYLTEHAVNIDHSSIEWIIGNGRYLPVIFRGEFYDSVLAQIFHEQAEGSVSRLLRRYPLDVDAVRRTYYFTSKVFIQILSSGYDAYPAVGMAFPELSTHVNGGGQKYQLMGTGRVVTPQEIQQKFVQEVESLFRKYSKYFLGTDKGLAKNLYEMLISSLVHEHDPINPFRHLTSLTNAPGQEDSTKANEVNKSVEFIDTLARMMVDSYRAHSLSSDEMVALLSRFSHISLAMVGKEKLAPQRSDIDHAAIQKLREALQTAMDNVSENSNSKDVDTFKNATPYVAWEGYYLRQVAEALTNATVWVWREFSSTSHQACDAYLLKSSPSRTNLDSLSNKTRGSGGKLN